MNSFSYYNFSDFKDFDHKTMVKILSIMPVIVYSPVDSITSSPEMFIGLKNNIFENPRYGEVYLFKENSDKLFSKMSISIFANEQECLKNASNDYDNMGLGLEQMTEMFGEEVLLGWLNGKIVNVETVDADGKEMIVSCSNAKSYWEQSHLQCKELAHNNNSIYGNDYRGMLFMNDVARKDFEFELESENYQEDNEVQTITDEASINILNEFQLVDKNINFYSSYAYVQGFEHNIKNEHSTLVQNTINTIYQHTFFTERNKEDGYSKDNYIKEPSLRM